MTIPFPVISEKERIHRLQPPEGKINMVLDTDAYNEIDDQFAIVYALLSKDRINLQAIYAAPFHNERSQGPRDGMEKSFQEIMRILERMNQSPEGFVFRGSVRYLSGKQEPVDSDAARDLVARAMAAPDDEPLYVVAIGAITNVASAILLEPRIIQKIVVIWLGGHAFGWNDAKEFNLSQDVRAAQLLFDCGVPLVLIPCYGVASHLITTWPEIKTYVKGRGKIGDFLADRFENSLKDHFGRSRVIWDLAAVAYLLHPQFVPTSLVHSPILTDQMTWSWDTARHLIRCACFVHRDAVFTDFS